tara:strand:+ start:3922 stop:4212 length:291 start_codon:yes stop_codon:yes gene_type:complete
MSFFNKFLKKLRTTDSLMDKSLNQDGFSLNFMSKVAKIPTLRASYKDGGIVDPIDQEILELEMFVGLTPTNAMEAFWIEQMKDRLSYLYDVKKGKQ